MRTNTFIKLFFFIFFIFGVTALNSKVLTFDLSQKNVEISNDLGKVDFTVFGFTDSKDSLVLKVKGPNQKVVLQKKKKFFGMWTWNKTGEFSYPGLYHYYTNNKNDEIVFEIKKDLVDNIKLIGKDDDNLKKDLIRKKKSIDLFFIKNNSFEVINEKIPNFFKIPVKLPFNSPTGEYFVSLSIMGKGNNFETSKLKINVSKPGVSSFVFKFAHKYSFIYGLFSAIIAIGLGLLAGVVFRK